MTRQVEDVPIHSAKVRAKLPISKHAVWKGLVPGKHLGYRKGSNGGVWVVRVRVGTTYKEVKLGSADDADDCGALSYAQACKAALAYHPDAKSAATVSCAVSAYLDWFRQNRRGLKPTASMLKNHILPALGTVELDRLTAAMLRGWLASLGTRVGKGSANRVWVILRAVLNQAYATGLIDSDEAWRRVQAFKVTDTVRMSRLSVSECRRLIVACPSDFRDLVRAALFTGGRYGELAAMQVSDFNCGAGTILFRVTKSGHERYVPLNAQGLEFFKKLCAGRDGSESILSKRDGTAWKPSEQTKRMAKACADAGIQVVNFHALRHTYASLLVESGVPIIAVARALGHADSRLTENVYAHLSPSYLSEQLARLPVV
jgi:integrase